MTPERILLVGPLPTPPLLGGVETGVALLLQSELARQMRFTLFNTARVADSSRPALEKIAYQLRACARFTATVIRTRPDVVHVKTSAGINFYQNVLYLVIARALRRRTILQLHDGTFPAFYGAANTLQRFVIRWGLRLPHRLLALSESWASYFAELSGATIIAVVPNALETQVFAESIADRQRFGIGEDRLAVLFVGTRDAELDARKGIWLLVEALANARKRHPTLLLVLAGPACQALDLSDQLGEVGDGWVAVGSIGNSDKAVLYKSVDVFALPSEAENMPNTVLEAMAAGLPIIATAVGAVPEMITDGEDGCLVPVGDPSALAQCIDHLASDPVRRQHLGHAAAERARQNYDLSVLTRRLADEYRRTAVIQKR